MTISISHCQKINFAAPKIEEDKGAGEYVSHAESFYKKGGENVLVGGCLFFKWRFWHICVSSADSFV